MATRYRGAANGAMLAWRDGALGPFDEDDRRLAADAAAHLALALQQVAAHEQLMELSSTDSLTGLLNRRSFMAALERRFERASAGHGGGALVYCDLDNFKQVNDTHGHERIAAARSAKAMTALAWKAGFSMRFAVKLQSRYANVPSGELLHPRDGFDYPMSEEDMTWQIGFYAS